MKRSVEGGAVLVLIGWFVAMSLTGVMDKSATVDEFAHLAAGVQAWKTFDFSLYDKTPPLGRMVQTLPALIFSPRADLPAIARNSWQPWVFAEKFARANADGFGPMLMASRMMTIVISVLIGVLVWRASRHRYGPAGGLISLAACALCPTLIAHGALVTTDAPAALAGLVFALLLLHYLEQQSFVRAALMGAGAGLAVMVKFNGLVWVPVAAAAPFVVLVKFWIEGWRPLVWKVVGHTLLALAAAYVIVMAGYGNFLPAPNPGLRPTSRLLKPFIDQFRKAPLPPDFILGLDAQLADSESGEFAESNYLRGEWRSGRRWSYYPIAAAVKEPLPLIALFVAALAAIAVWGPRRKDEITLIALILLYVAALMTSRLQIGVRYLLTIYPLAFILMGRLARPPRPTSPGLNRSAEVAAMGGMNLRARARQALIAAALIWLLLASAFAWPDYIAYFNLAAGGKDQGRNWLLDSNLDWGQDLPGLARWMKKNQVGRLDLAYFGADNPRRFGIDFDLPAEKSKNRYIAISANLLMGRKYPMLFLEKPVTKQDPLWELLPPYRDRAPEAVIGGSIFVYNKSPESP